MFCHLQLHNVDQGENSKDIPWIQSSFDPQDVNQEYDEGNYHIGGKEQGFIGSLQSIGPLNLVDFFLADFLNPIQESPFKATHLHDASTVHRLRDKCDSTIGNGGNGGSVVGELVAEVELKWHEYQKEQGKANGKGWSQRPPSHHQNGNGLKRRPEYVVDEQGCHQEAIDIVAGQVHDPSRVGIGALMGRRESQGFGVDGGHTRGPHLHPLAPGDEKDMMVLEQDNDTTGNQNTGPDVALAVPSFEGLDQLAQCYSLHDGRTALKKVQRLHLPCGLEVIDEQRSMEIRFLGTSLPFFFPQRLKVLPLLLRGVDIQDFWQIKLGQRSLQANLEQRKGPRKHQSCQRRGIPKQTWWVR